MLTISKKKATQLGWRLYQRREEAWANPTGQEQAQRYTLRLATPADFSQMAELLTGLSADSRYLRFLSPLPPFTPERAGDLARQLWLENRWPTQVLLATIHKEAGEKLIGLAELHTNPGNMTQADFALLVRDEWQGQGVGTLLLERLIALGARRGVTTLRSEIHPYNKAMRKVLSKQNLPLSYKFEGGTMEVALKLG